MTPCNYHQVRDHVEFFAALGVRHFRFSTYGRSYYRHDDRLFTPDEIRSRAAELLEAAVDEAIQLLKKAQSSPNRHPALIQARSLLQYGSVEQAQALLDEAIFMTYLGLFWFGETVF